MDYNNSIVIPVDCTDEECGMVSHFRCYGDGSYRKTLDACGHAKRIPTRDAIHAAFGKGVVALTQG